MLELPSLVEPDGTSWLFGCRARGVEVADAVYDRFAQVPGLLDGLATMSFAETCAVWDAWHAEQMEALPEADRPILEQLNLGAFLDRVRRIRRGKLRAALTKPVARYAPEDSTLEELTEWYLGELRRRATDVKGDGDARQAETPSTMQPERLGWGAGLKRSRNGHRPGSFEPPRSPQNGSAT